MKIKNNIIYLLFGILAIPFLAWNFYQLGIRNAENLSYKFDGVVEYVTYDKKGIPDIIVNKTEFYLSAGWNFDHLIEKGDTIRKTKGDLRVILIKPKNKLYTFTQ